MEETIILIGLAGTIIILFLIRATIWFWFREKRAHLRSLLRDDNNHDKERTKEI